jgi:Zn ribbon nucleic-acid-binding protein
MPLVGIEPAIPPSKWPQTEVLECMATGIEQKSYTDEIRKSWRDRNIQIVGQRSQK